MSTSASRESGGQRRKLGDILKSQNMHYVVLRNPANPTTEYWVISPTAKKDAVDDFAAVLRSHDNGRPNDKPKRPKERRPNPPDRLWPFLPDIKNP